MQQIDDSKPRATNRARALLVQIVAAFEVLAERQYAAPWSASKRCDQAC